MTFHQLTKETGSRRFKKICPIQRFRTSCAWIPLTRYGYEAVSAEPYVRAPASSCDQNRRRNCSLLLGRRPFGVIFEPARSRFAPARKPRTPKLEKFPIFAAPITVRLTDQAPEVTTRSTTLDVRPSASYDRMVPVVASRQTQYTAASWTKGFHRLKKTIDHGVTTMIFRQPTKEKPRPGFKEMRRETPLMQYLSLVR